MPRNVYWELFYHLIWHTKDSAPLLNAKVEPLTHKYLVHRALQTPETIVHGVGGIEDHVHMAVSLPPTVEIAKWIGDLKERAPTRSTTAHVGSGRWRGRPATGSCRSGRATCRGCWITSGVSANITPLGASRTGSSGSRSSRFKCLKAGALEAR